MRRNWIPKYIESMDSLQFSKEEKETMVMKLMEKSQPAKKSGKQMLVLVLAASIALLALTGAGLYTRWSHAAQSQYNPSEDVKQQAAGSGLSVMLENTEAANGDVLQAEDQGITVTAVQSIVDNYQAQIYFRVEGFDLPEGRLPAAMPEVTIDGKTDYYSSRSGWFFDGTAWDENNNLVYAATGKPVQSDENGTLIYQYVAPDGSMEYIYAIRFQDGFGDVNGKELQFHFDSFDYQSNEKAGMPEPAVSGSWDLHWKLSRSDEANATTLNAPIGDTGVTVLDVTIGQMTIETNYQLSQPFEGFKTMEDFPQELWGVQMKDGTQCRVAPRTTNYDEASLRYYAESEVVDAILDPSQVESLMFLKSRELDEAGNPTVRTFYYIPIHQ